MTPQPGDVSWVRRIVSQQLSNHFDALGNRFRTHDLTGPHTRVELIRRQKLGRRLAECDQQIERQAGHLEVDVPTRDLPRSGIDDQVVEAIATFHGSFMHASARQAMLTSMVAIAAPMPRDRVNRFHLRLACVFVLVAFGGFTPSYWSRVAAGTFAGAPIYHIHGLLLFGWTCLYLAQTALVASGRTLRHRALGLVGIA